MKIGIIGGGAFGTALGVALAMDSRQVQLWARDPAAVAQMQEKRTNARLPGVSLPGKIAVSASLDPVFVCDTVLLAIPAQALAPFLTEHGARLGARRWSPVAKGSTCIR